MSFFIDPTTLLEVGSKNPLYLAWWIFINGGWVFFLFLFVLGLYIARLEGARMKNRLSKKYILLALDIPKNNEQSLKAVEQIFAQLASVESKKNLVEKYWQGKVQDSFSLEIVGIGGYIQYVIRTSEEHRDLVEAAIYAQYPDAEITEVYDYVDQMPTTFPNNEYELWGTELVLAKKEAYPIRTYLNFEHSLTQKFADPMAALLEALSRLQPEEQVWVQILITPPVTTDWIAGGEHIVKKLIGEKITTKKTDFFPFSHVYNAVKGFGDEASRQILGEGVLSGEQKEKNELPSKMQYLSPGLRNAVEAIEEKISKIGFKTKIRIIYIAKKEIFNKPRGVNPVMGAILQYNTQNLNALKSQKKIKTKVDYFMVKRRLAYRQKKIMRAYKRRANWLGWGEGFMLNIEELASIYHFPGMEITAPQVKRTEIRKAGPPPILPTEILTPKTTAEEASIIKATPAISKAGPPANLPIVTEEENYEQSPDTK